ncbi:hypothetical protein PPAR_a1892 [Pseudoalteromonas paragorgicola KMM 3548]|uniref:Uncharacterized protein n=1 Tax=Pseudoalteromonas arctica A 37-1-2 TaxID=1117313 RepID=A0A290S3L8_9GAMM|nr:hypothetical protein PARC_a2269 [Pseudoalteromonas arctica A 37-1-2]EGI72760.1 hypothetical protein PH505_be00350 [Pseudoalteromonas distincta]MBE3673809.1 hypothetical protein [Pseudoalteromonas distincta KMM 3548]GAA67531.1 hypothetical protein P20429_1646 [Pseudoalteromonas sp. BSi20429]
MLSKILSIINRNTHRTKWALRESLNMMGALTGTYCTS